LLTATATVGCDKSSSRTAPTTRPSSQASRPAEMTYPWADAVAGDFVRILTDVQSPVVTALEVVQADQKEVVVNLTVITAGATSGAAKEIVYSRKDDPSRIVDFVRQARRLAPQSLTVAGKKVQCDVYELQTGQGPDTTVKRLYLSPQVPGRLVRMEQGPPGGLRVVSEVVDFARKQ